MSRALWGLHFLDTLEKLLDATLSDSEVFIIVTRRADSSDLPHVTPLHRVGLAWSRLSIGENRAMVALEAWRVFNIDKKTKVW